MLLVLYKRGLFFFNFLFLGLPATYLWNCPFPGFVGSSVQQHTVSVQGHTPLLGNALFYRGVYWLAIARDAAAHARCIQTLPALRRLSDPADPM
eukprot:1322241-Amphidinium_carterae.1